MLRVAQVGVYAFDNDGIPVHCGNISMRALKAFIPAVLRELRSHRDDRGAFITDIVLPMNSRHAVTRIIGWMKACARQGRIAPFLYANSNARQEYADILKVSEEVSIGYLIDVMTKRLAAMDEARARRKDEGADTDNDADDAKEVRRRDEIARRDRLASEH